MVAPALVFVDEPRTPKGGGKTTARMFTNGHIKDLASLALRAGIPSSAYVPPILHGAHVVEGGFFRLSVQQRRWAVGAGAIPVDPQPEDLDLAGRIAVAMAQTRVKAAGLG